MAARRDDYSPASLRSCRSRNSSDEIRRAHIHRGCGVAQTGYLSIWLPDAHGHFFGRRTTGCDYSDANELVRRLGVPIAKRAASVKAPVNPGEPSGTENVGVSELH